MVRDFEARDLANREVPLHRSEIEFAGVAVRTDTRLMEVDQACHVRRAFLASIVDDPENAFLAHHRLLVAVRHEAAQRRLIPDDLDAIDCDLTVDVPARGLVLEMGGTGAATDVDGDVLDRAAESDGAVAVYGRGDAREGEG